MLTCDTTSRLDEYFFLQWKSIHGSEFQSPQPPKTCTGLTARCSLLRVGRGFTWWFSARDHLSLQTKDSSTVVPHFCCSKSVDCGTSLSLRREWTAKPWGILEEGPLEHEHHQKKEIVFVSRVWPFRIPPTRLCVLTKGHPWVRAHGKTSGNQR